MTDGGEECDVYTDGSGNYAYKKGGLWYEATGSSTETSANFSPTGTVLPSSTQLASVQVYSVKKHQRTDPVYSDGASYYDYNGSLYYQCSYSNGVVTHPSSGAKSVSSYSGDAFNVKINVGGTDYPAFIYTSTGGQADTLYHDGSNYYKVHFGYNSSTQPVIMDDTLAIWTAPAEAGAIEYFTGTVPTTDQ